MGQAMILRRGGGAGRFPVFSYSGTYQFSTDDSGNWKIRFLTSGTLRFSKISSPMDLFLVGGGARAAHRT